MKSDITGNNGLRKPTSIQPVIRVPAPSPYDGNGFFNITANYDTRRNAEMAQIRAAMLRMTRQPP